MAHAIKLNELTKDMNLEKNMSTLKHLLVLMSCSPPAEGCLMNNCTQCTEKDVLQQDLHDILECNIIDAITYNQCLTTDACNLDTVTSTTDEVVEKFVSSLKELKVYDFAANQQSSFFKETKSSLQDGEVIVLGISRKIINLIFRMLHKDFTGITRMPPFIPLLAILKIIRMSWKTYVL
jgi:hypothetical protein